MVSPPFPPSSPVADHSPAPGASPPPARNVRNENECISDSDKYPNDPRPRRTVRSEMNRWSRWAGSLLLCWRAFDCSHCSRAPELVPRIKYEYIFSVSFIFGDEMRWGWERDEWQIIDFRLGIGIGIINVIPDWYNGWKRILVKFDQFIPRAESHISTIIYYTRIYCFRIIKNYVVEMSCYNSFGYHWTLLNARYPLFLFFLSNVYVSFLSSLLSFFRSYSRSILPQRSRDVVLLIYVSGLLPVCGNGGEGEREREDREMEEARRRRERKSGVLVAADSAWTVQGWRCTLLEDIYVSVVASRRLTKSGATCLERRATTGVNQPELTPSHPTRRFRLRRRWQAHVHVHPRPCACAHVQREEGEDSGKIPRARNSHLE